MVTARVLKQFLNEAPGMEGSPACETDLEDSSNGARSLSRLNVVERNEGYLNGSALASEEDSDMICG